MYNLNVVLTESNDVSAQFPEIVAQIEAIMKREHTPADLDIFKIKELGYK